MLRHNERASEIQSARHWWGQWPSWAGYAAAVWSLAYAMVGLYWTLGGPGFPFGENDPASHFSAFAGADVGAPAIAMLSLLGAVAAVATRHVRSRGGSRLVLLGFCWIVAATLLFVVPDARALVALAYAPVALLGAPFGWPPGDYRNAPTLATARRGPARTAGAGYRSVHGRGGPGDGGRPDDLATDAARHRRLYPVR